MYACLCQAVSEETVREYIAQGYTSFDALKGALCVGIQCGSCRLRIFEILHEEMAKTMQQPRSQPPQ